MARLSKIVFAATLLAGPATVFAEDPPADGTTPDGGGGGDGTAGGAPAGGDGTTPAAGDGSMAPADGAMPAASGLTLGKGKIAIGGETVTINMSADAVGKPIAIAPSIWYGVSDKLTVGVTHDGGSTKFTPRPGLSLQAISILGVSVLAGKAGGICLTGDMDGGCPKVYDNVSLDALFSVKAGKFSLAAHPALDIGSFDPFLLSLRVGAVGTYAASDKITVAFDPRIKIGITERDFNKESLDIPVWLWYHVNEKMGVAVNTGIAGPLDGFGDAFVVPVGLNVSYKANEKLDVGGDFSFVNLAGKNSSADYRALGIRVGYAL
jgi:hypothetical protein